MQVFISHKIEGDAELAVQLQTSLGKEGIFGYVAELKQEYDILISDKIKEEINNSEYLVTIFTENSINSASVHQEIGYALGKDIPVLLMVEEKINEKGVLIFGKDPELFTTKFFPSHADKITEFIKNKGFQKSTNNVESSESFLKKRNLELESPDFAANENTEFLWPRIDDKELPNGKSYLLFSACPKKLQNIVDPNSNDLTKWINEQGMIELKDGQHCRFIEGTKKIKLGSISYHKNPIGDERIYKYTEFHKNGFIEQGITDPIIRGEPQEDKQIPFLHLCWFTGALWAFVKFCKKYYDKIDFKNEFEIKVSIRNSQDLTLAGFGGLIQEHHEWAEPFSSHWGQSIPHTTEKNISLTLDSLSTSKLTESFIEQQIHEISNQISNAFGLEKSRCFNYDDTFNFKMFSWYNT